MESFGELIIEAREKASKKKVKEATVYAKECLCSVTVSIFSEGSYFRQGEPVPISERPNNHGSSLEIYEKCYDHEDRPRVLAARRAS